MVRVSASLKRLQDPAKPEKYFVNGDEVAKEVYMGIYHQAETLDAFHTKGALKRGVKSYVHSCEARGVPAHLVPAKKVVTKTETDKAE